MKEDEIKFFKIVTRHCRCSSYINGFNNAKITVRDVINIIDEFINHKRCWYLLRKWSGLGFYNYGVTLDLGWIELDKLPDRYKELLCEMED